MLSSGLRETRVGFTSLVLTFRVGFILRLDDELEPFFSSTISGCDAAQKEPETPNGADRLKKFSVLLNATEVCF